MWNLHRDGSRKRADGLEPDPQVAVGAREGLVYIVRQNDVFAEGMLPPEGRQIPGLEVVCGPLTLDDRRPLAIDGKYKIDFMPVFLPPAKQFTSL